MTVHELIAKLLEFNTHADVMITSLWDVAAYPITSVRMVEGQSWEGETLTFCLIESNPGHSED